MTAPDLTGLRALAEVATPEWEAWWTLDNGQLEVFVPNGTMSTETVLQFKDFLDCEECVRPSEADARFIAAANPTAVLALLDEVEALRAAYDDLEAARLETMDQRDQLRATVERVEALAASWDRWDDYAQLNFGEKTHGPGYARALRAAIEGTTP